MSISAVEDWEKLAWSDESQFIGIRIWYQQLESVDTTALFRPVVTGYILRFWFADWIGVAFKVDGEKV